MTARVEIGLWEVCVERVQSTAAFQSTLADRQSAAEQETSSTASFGVMSGIRQMRNQFDQRVRYRLSAIASVAIVCHSATVSGGVQQIADVQRPEVPITNGDVRCLVESCGVLYLGGDFSYLGLKTGGLALLDSATAQLDPSFPRLEGSTITAIVSDNSGGWFLGGSFSSVGGLPRHNLAHVRADHTVDKNWNPGTDGQVLALVVSGHTVFVGGGFAIVGGEYRRLLAALDATTGEVRDWDPSPNGGAVRSLAVAGDVVYVGGNFYEIGGQTRHGIASVDSTSGLVSEWNPNANNDVLALAVSGGTVLAGGRFTTIGGQARSRIAAIDSSSGLATGWVSNANGQVDTIAVSGNSVFAGGQFTSIKGTARNYVAELDVLTGNPTDWEPEVGSKVSTIGIVGDKAYIGGDFGVGAWWRNRSTPIAWKPLSTGGCRALAAGEETICVGGEFSSIGGVNRNRLAAIDTKTGVPTSWNPGADESVFALAIARDTVYLGGEFSAVGGQTRNRVAAVDKFTGELKPWNPNAGGDVYALAVSENTVFVGGFFETIGGATRIGVAELDSWTAAATSWNPTLMFNDFVTGSVSAIAMSEDSIYVGGKFNSIDGQVRHNIASFHTIGGDLTNWNPNVTGPASASFGTIVPHGETIFVGGSFTGIGGSSQPYIAALDAHTGTASPWNPMSDGSVNALAIAGDTMFVVGNFLAIGFQWRQHVAALNIDSGSALTWSPFMLGQVYALAVTNDSVYLGGQIQFSGLAAFSLTWDGACGDVLLGDTNHDGVVDGLDIGMFVRILLNLDVSSPADVCAADLNRNCGVTTDDVLPFVMHLLGTH